MSDCNGSLESPKPVDDQVLATETVEIFDQQCVEVSCDGRFEFMKGVISVLCAKCHSINCLMCQEIHKPDCDKKTEQAVDVFDTPKMYRGLPKLRKRLFSPLTTSTKVASLQASDTLETSTEDDDETMRKRMKLDSPAYISKLGKGICRVCPFETAGKASFLNHIKTSKHRNNMTKFKVSGKYVD